MLSLASGGAIFIGYPHQKVSSEQLNGERLADFTMKDLEVILSFLDENEKLSGISIEKDLLTVHDKLLDSMRVYRKIEPITLQELNLASRPGSCLPLEERVTLLKQCHCVGPPAWPSATGLQAFYRFGPRTPRLLSPHRSTRSSPAATTVLARKPYFGFNRSLIHGGLFSALY